MTHHRKRQRPPRSIPGEFRFRSERGNAEGPPNAEGSNPGGPNARRPGFGQAAGPAFIPNLGADEEGARGPRLPRRGARPGGFGQGAGFGPGFGPPFGHGPHRRGRRGGRARGDVRAAILLLLSEEPRHGYQLIQDITERSSGAWTPSPGSIYPTLQALEDEGLVVIEAVDGRRTASLTAGGVAYVQENREALGVPWEAGGNAPVIALNQNLRTFLEATQQVLRVGTARQHAAAAAVLAAARKDLYRILAEDSERPEEPAE